MVRWTARPAARASCAAARGLDRPSRIRRGPSRRQKNSIFILGETPPRNPLRSDQIIFGRILPIPITSACQYRSSTATFSTTMETWINCFSRARIRMEKLAYYLLQPLRPENWKTQGATYLVLRKNEGLNAEKLTYRLMQPDRGGRPA